MHRLYGNNMLAQPCTGYDFPPTLILSGNCAGRIILDSFIVILKCVTMATEIFGRRWMNLETLTQKNNDMLWSCLCYPVAIVCESWFLCTKYLF